MGVPWEESLFLLMFKCINLTHSEDKTENYVDLKINLGLWVSSHQQIPANGVEGCVAECAESKPLLDRMKERRVFLIEH